MKANELSCKDLMIGDWVMINPISYYQVEQIRVEFGELRIYLKDTEVFATENEIIPVPLTPEILEKNFPIADGCQYRDDNNGVCIEVYFNAKTEKYKKYVILYTDRGKIYINRYVHQLQHALRLLGINKEIEL